MLHGTSAVNVANSVAIDVANDVLPVCWMEVYPFCINQSKSLFHAAILNDKINLKETCCVLGGRTAQAIVDTAMAKLSSMVKDRMGGRGGSSGGSRSGGGSQVSLGGRSGKDFPPTVDRTVPKILGENNEFVTLGGWCKRASMKSQPQPRRGLEIMDTRLGFSCHFRSVVIDSISLLTYKVQYLKFCW